MPTHLEALEAEVLKLGRADRLLLVESLITSHGADLEVEAAWDLEAERREALMESGAVTGVSAQDAMNRLRQKIVQ
ncbi:MAG: addiction module protein [Hydrogenophaga sp.]|uniref:addiction module protein n=1 Tax=Hydrogenophaga sp. TaxID=1904254 RepID=UPI002ABB22F7|nr:addiction module protein [Hydrogenophaga sp.]MDZ4280971.1 addiction module protein [Hydrogenophaga sp.]